MTNYKYKAEQNKRTALRLFNHYMNQLHFAAGVKVDNDMRAEWQDILDCTIKAAVYEALDRLEDRNEPNV